MKEKTSILIRQAWGLQSYNFPSIFYVSTYLLWQQTYKTLIVTAFLLHQITREVAYRRIDKHDQGACGCTAEYVHISHRRRYASDVPTEAPVNSLSERSSLPLSRDSASCLGVLALGSLKRSKRPWRHG